MAKRYRGLLASVTIMGSLLIAGTAHAWLTVNNNQFAAQDEATYGCSLDLYAQDGNVVSTNKWNCAIAKIKFIAQVLADWPKGNTPTMSIGTRTDGSIFTAWLNLGATDGPRQMTIGFYDATQNYTSTPPRARISYSTTVGVEEGALTFNAGSGGVRAYNPRDTSYELLGWKSIDTASGQPFRLGCQYRITTTHWHVLLFGQTATDGSVIVGSFPRESTGRWMARLAILSSNKTGYDLVDADNGTAMPTGASYGDGSVVELEELCFPRYGL